MRENKLPDGESVKRRSIIKYGIQGAAMTLMSKIIPQTSERQVTPKITRQSKNGKIIVVGAGAFGGWTALHLLRKGYDVTLLDQFGPGNNQSSSGGETRIIRAFYGSQQIYFELTLRAIQLWKENEALMGQKILHQNGLLVFVPVKKDESVEAAIPMYKKAGLVFEKFSAGDAAKRWPQVNTADLDHVMFDPVAGILLARKGCNAVCDLFEKEGGKFMQQQAKDYAVKSGKCKAVTLYDGTMLEADEFVFACGPWLVRLFPEITGKLKVTRQVVFFFASPPGESDLMENKLPVWFNMDTKGVVNLYGIPGNEYRGFKAAPELKDVITDRFDTYSRFWKPEELKYTQEIVALRFPKMAGRPLIENRVCQYTETPDSDFIFDRHPGVENLWILGGGSGHGYKMGASLGELAAAIIIGEKNIHPTFALSRLLK
jgi:glycine/D-amino acid oxidase-like deaminating enzyme